MKNALARGVAKFAVSGAALASVFAPAAAAAASHMPVVFTPKIELFLMRENPVSLT